MSLAFLPFHNAGEHNALSPLLVPGWTLNYEMFFYALFALVLWLQPKRLALASSCLLGALVAAGLVFPGYFYLSPIIFEFALGIVIARVYERVTLPPGVPAVLIIAGFAVLVLTEYIPAHQGAAVAIVLGAVVWERTGKLPLWKFGTDLGDASYSIYLIHIFVLGVIRTLWGATIGGRDDVLAAAAFVIVATAAVIVVSLACYRWVESPTTSALQRWWTTPKSRADLMRAA
jgi:exopolysaccharide production protein ExoZ